MSHRERWLAKQQALFRLHQTDSTLLSITNHGVVVEVRIEAHDRKHKATLAELTRMTGTRVASHSADDRPNMTVESDLWLLFNARDLNGHCLR